MQTRDVTGLRIRSTTYWARRQALDVYTVYVAPTPQPPFAPLGPPKPFLRPLLSDAPHGTHAAWSVTHQKTSRCMADYGSTSTALLLSATE